MNPQSDSLEKRSPLLHKTYTNQNNEPLSSEAAKSPADRTLQEAAARERASKMMFFSNIQQPGEHNQPLKTTFVSQSLALFRKNYTQQAKQKGTNFCQIITPVLCLLLLFVVKNLVNAKVKAVFDFQMDYPYMFNVPYKRLYNNTLTPIKITDCLQWYLYDFEGATEETRNFVYNSGNETSALLDNVFSHVGNSPDFYYCRNCQNNVPYFKPPSDSSINEQIYNDIRQLNQKTFTSNEDIAGSYVLPDGAVTFYEANPKNISYKVQINDINFPEYHRGNGISKLYVYDTHTGNTVGIPRASDGQLALIDLVSKSYLEMINPNVVLVSGSQYMPMPGMEANLLLKLLSMTESCLYPMALSLLLPVFMYALVLEKEERLREMMKMNGLKMKNYWITNYIWNLLLFIPSAAIFTALGYLLVQMPFFTQTSFALIFLIIFGWGVSQVSLSFFFQNFFSKARTVTILGYMLSIWTTIIAVALNVTIFPDTSSFPIALNLYPPFAFCRIIYTLSTECSDGSCIENFSQLTPVMWTSLIGMYVGAFAILLVGLYLEQVWPQEFGVARHPFFFITDCFDKKKKQEKAAQLAMNANKQDTTTALGLNMEDEDVRQERETINNLEAPYEDYPLVVRNLRKVYKAIGGKPPKVAVQNFSLHIEKGEMFGLLGPNGAGKTSLISMLTGLYKPESGNAWVAGSDIVDNIDQVRTKMGVCPQFDLLWPDLTVKEHLLFYARIRGVPRAQEQEIVEKAIAEVQLTKSTNHMASQLSGGMKRRLSVAISLVGDPKIVILDEPTTGLDPETRRQLWDILMEARGSRAMVLTTHSMEEADVLCTRIGIITKGALRCVGPQTRLKSKYGGGYNLLINCQHEDSFESEMQVGELEQSYSKIKEFIQELLPSAILKSSFNGNFIYHIPLEGLVISKVFEELESKKVELGISDWGISQATLEDVFMEVVDASDEDFRR